jgi:molybdate transport system substrate-binding protein
MRWILVALLLLPACSSSEQESLNVFAASSLTDVFEELAPDERFNFAGSDDLTTQIREGAPADVFASASPKYSDELFADGLIDKPVTFATNSLVIVVPVDNPANIQHLGDLAAPGVKVVIADVGVPAGDYARTILENLGQNAVLDNVVSEEQDVKGVVGKVALGEADAGFAYLTDVRSSDVAMIELPAEAQPDISYTIAVVTDSANREAAQAFVGRVLGDAGRSALQAAGFGLP